MRPGRGASFIEGGFFCEVAHAEELPGLRPPDILAGFNERAAGEAFLVVMITTPAAALEP